MYNISIDIIYQTKYMIAAIAYIRVEHYFPSLFFPSFESSLLLGLNIAEHPLLPTRVAADNTWLSLGSESSLPRVLSSLVDCQTSA